MHSSGWGSDCDVPGPGPAGSRWVPRCSWPSAASRALSVGRPKRITGRGFSVCVNAIVAGAMNQQPQPITLIVIIERGKIADRRRATAQDGCAGETYEKVEAANSGSR